jgi:hypothetical protein
MICSRASGLETGLTVEAGSSLYFLSSFSTAIEARIAVSAAVMKAYFF